jgi:prepilin-type N-terminal cleavage/methylation domain-containing protein
MQKKTISIICRARPNCRDSGFSLTETLVTSSLIGILASIAVPGYIGQKSSSCQSYPESIISQAMSQAQAYNDEYADLAKSWYDLDKISTIMTSSGPAQSENLNWIELPKCNYKLMGNRSGNEYTFIAAQSGSFIPPEEQDNNNEIDELKNKYNVVGCVNVATGASDIQSGTGETAVSTSSLSCG